MVCEVVVSVRKEGYRAVIGGNTFLSNFQLKRVRLSKSSDKFGSPYQISFPTGDKITL